MADLVGSRHRFITLDPGALADPALRRAVITARDMPVGFGETDTSLYLLFQAIKAESTVALSGESADEVFGGYRWFHDPAARQRAHVPVARLPQPDERRPGRAAAPRPAPHLDLDTYVADEYATAVAGGRAPGRRAARSTGGCGLIGHLHLTRFVRMLLDRKDRMSMAVGLEVRVPFCDHRLVEYVYNTPWALKTFDGREKSLLRAATAHVLPDSVAGRRKSPYPSTQDPLYAVALQQQAKEVLAEQDHPVHAVLDQDWLTAVVNADVSKPSERPARHRPRPRPLPLVRPLPAGDPLD